MKSVLAILTLMLVLTVALAEEATTVYTTWADYKASGAPTSTWNDVVDAMDALLDYGKELYASGDTDGAYKTVSNAYYGYYETTGFERIAMGYISGSRKSEMELQFSACKSVAKKGGTAEEFNEQVDLLESMLRWDANILDGTPEKNVSEDAAAEETSDSGESVGMSESTLKRVVTEALTEYDASKTVSTTRTTEVADFIACYTILVKEGFEAILIVAAILAYLKKSDADKLAKRRQCGYVYFGSVMGIVLSFVLAWLLNVLKLANSASQEIIEGITALTAVVVLFYVSNWMLSKSESQAWTKYVRSKVEKSSSNGSYWALAFTAFLSVFREGAEVVLFYQPVLNADHSMTAVWGGFFAAVATLVVIYYLIAVLSMKLPLKPFFTGCSILMMIMCISFLGGGIKELIEGDVILSSTAWWVAWIPSNDITEALGLYPLTTTIVPQIILAVIMIILFMIQGAKNRKIKLAAIEAKAEEDKRVAEEQAAAAAKAAEEAKKANDENTKRLIREVLTEMGLGSKK